MNSEEKREFNFLFSYDYREATKVVTLIKQLNKSNISLKDIGGITPYSGQRRRLQSLLIENDLAMVVAQSVNAYQGQERDYIIISCVRSNTNGYKGFLTDRRRLNVAITRARRGMIIAGNVGCVGRLA